MYNVGYCCMKQRERCSGREFDSPHLHQKDFHDQWKEEFPPLNLWNYSLQWQWLDNIDESLSDGGD